MNYDYECNRCGKVQEVEHSILETPKVYCTCGEQCHRLVGAPRFILKGSGWASDGYSSTKKDAPSA